MRAQLVMLETRALLIAVGTLTSSHVKTGQCCCMAILVAAVVLQHRFKPFAEDEKAAKHWTSVNKQAELALACQFGAISLGLASTVVGWDSADGRALQFPITLGSLFCFFTPLVMTVAAEWHNLRGLSEELEHMLEDQKFINPLQLDDKDEDDDKGKNEDNDEDEDEGEDAEDSGDDVDQSEVDKESGDTRPEPESEPDGAEQDAELGAQPGGDA